MRLTPHKQLFKALGTRIAEQHFVMQMTNAVRSQQDL